MYQFLADIMSYLAAVNGVQHVAIYNQQYDRIETPDENGNIGYLFAMPAVFVEADFSNVKLMGQGVQLYEPVVITLHIVMNELDAGNGTLDQNVSIFNLKNSVYLAMEKKYPTGGGMLVRTGEGPDYGHNNVYVFKQTYTCTLVDGAGKDPIGGITAAPPITFNITNTI